MASHTHHSLSSETRGSCLWGGGELGWSQEKEKSPVCKRETGMGVEVGVGWGVGGGVGKLVFLRSELRTDTLSKEPSGHQTLEDTLNQAVGHWQGALVFLGCWVSTP